ncbi:hypothetical protein KBY26_12850, partial [Ruegeria pomeroyi]|nr:hypothetical protein [Ruegeria pomeroyi]
QPAHAQTNSQNQTDLLREYPLITRWATGGASTGGPDASERQMDLARNVFSAALLTLLNNIKVLLSCAA